MGFGDEVVAAGQAQRLWDADPSLRVGIFDINRKPRWHPIWQDNPIIAPPEAIQHGEPVHPLTSAPHARPYIVYPFTAESGWTFNRAFLAREHIARIYLTLAEVATGAALRQRIGPFVLIDPASKHPNLRWPVEHWTEMIKACPDLTFVQHTHRDTLTVIPGAIAIPSPSFRDACGLVLASDLYVRGESGMCHATAALGVPQVTIWGGCMDWNVLGGYPKQTGLVSDTEGSPCGRWLPCAHCEASMAGITVERVSAAIRAALEVYHGSR
jgi:hypothetical protein